VKVTKSQLRQIIKEELSKILNESHSFDMGGEDEEFDFTKMSDAQLVDYAHQDGIEEILVLDYEGDLVNREEVIMALKNV
jgi:hypothetical protein